MTMIVMAVGVIVLCMMAVMMRRRHRGADRGRAMERLQRADERASLHPQQPQPDQDDERIAHDLDPVDRALHGRRGGIEQRRRDADDHHRDQRLQQRGGERQHHAALPGLLVGDQVGRDHRLAVAGSGGVKHAIEERDAEQGPGRAAVGLGGADRARERAIEFGLLGEDPAEHPAGRGRRRALRPRHAERARLAPISHRRRRPPAG